MTAAAVTGDSTIAIRYDCFTFETEYLAMGGGMLAAPRRRLMQPTG